jgi:nucleotide-binding universal stress UspA family protein
MGDVTEGRTEMGTIVVGVDGSKGAVAALGYALEEARAHGSDLRAVCAWHTPITAYGSGIAPIPVDLLEFERNGQAALDRSLEGVDEVEGVTLTPVLREGQPADVLVEEAKDAELLVVGSRGLGGFRGLLLGSVSQQVAHHAPCPVVIVPTPPAAAGSAA